MISDGSLATRSAGNLSIITCHWTRLSGNAIALDHLPVELDAEAGLRADTSIMPSLIARAVGPHRLPHRVALGVGEALDVGAVRHAGEQLAGDLGFLVVRHPHAGAPADLRRAAPVGDAAAFRDVVIHVIHRAGVHQPAHAVAGDLALAGGDRDAGRLPHARHQRHVVVPVARLLEPADVERLDELREADRVVHVPAAVGVHHQQEVRSRPPCARLRPA